jgi:AbiTii
MEIAAVTRRQEALRLADELLRNIELAEIGASDIARKASRLARLLDDQEAMQWLGFEVSGYPALPSTLDEAAVTAATRSHRESSTGMFFTASLGSLQAELDGAHSQLAAASGFINGDYAAYVENTRRDERHRLRAIIGSRQALIDKIVGAIHQYAAERYQELRFGAAVESAFEVVRPRSTERSQASSQTRCRCSRQRSRTRPRTTPSTGRTQRVRAAGC